MRYLLNAVFVLAITMGCASVRAETVDAKAAEPDEKETVAIKDAIQKLQADDFDVREKASETLITFGRKAVALVKAAQKESRDNEVRQRSKKILEKIADAIELEGLTTLPNGLQYKIIKEGEGESPGYGDVVAVNYTGKLKDGTEFENSYKRGAAARLQVNSAVTGLTEGLIKMKPGAKWILVIPPKLGWGENGMPGYGGTPAIPPNATLIYKVELISVTKASIENGSSTSSGGGDGGL